MDPLETKPFGAMIPTQSKARLSKRLSYPLGAEAVSAALAGVPQYGLLRLTFHDRAGSAMQFQQVLNTGRPYVVMQAAFSRWAIHRNASDWMIERGWYDKKWQITLYPVLREYRHAARAALLEHALPAVRRWLSQPAASGWENGHRRLEFTLDPAAATVTAAEFGEALS